MNRISFIKESTRYAIVIQGSEDACIAGYIEITENGYEFDGKIFADIKDAKKYVKEYY